MSLVRIPRLWEKRHYYHEWKTLNENRDLDEDDALELFKHEERRWQLYEDELRNQYAVRQATLVNQINQLDSYIFDVLIQEAKPLYDEGGGYNDFRKLRDSAIREFTTEDGIYLVLEDGNILGPYLGA
tara:strand:+ start:227 stop:610 length:384 start_codon:yes stop_codon:yes gene_type:complete